jgi:hypothetical protein
LHFFEKFVYSVTFGALYLFVAVALAGFARELISLSILSAAIGVMSGGYLCMHIAFGFVKSRL